MADFSLPNNVSDYANVWDYVKAVQVSMALWLDGTTDTNIPTSAKRYSSANKRFEVFNGTLWQPLIPLDADQANAYQIRVAKANEADSVGVASNALNLGGVQASQFVQTTDARLSDARPCNNTFGNAAAARAALSVYSQAEVTAALAPKANLASPALTGTPTVPTAAPGTNTTQAASTAFVAAAVNLKLSYGPWVDLSAGLGTGWTVRAGLACRARTVSQDGAVIAHDFDIELDGTATSATTALVLNEEFGLPYGTFNKTLLQCASVTGNFYFAAFTGGAVYVNRTTTNVPLLLSFSKRVWVKP